MASPSNSADNKQTDYDFISNKIQSMKNAYPSLRDKSDDYVFSALAFKTDFYKNPSNVIDDSDFEEIIVDGRCDGGVDILLSDPNSDASDLVIGQSKYYTEIKAAQLRDALDKMATFYNAIEQDLYEGINEKVQSRYHDLKANIGDESKIHFVFYTSASGKNINNIESYKQRMRASLGGSSKFDVDIWFGSDIKSNIIESESIIPTVESGMIKVERDNCLKYGENAVVVNVSAFSIKTLYDKHNINLLALNLRYYVKDKDIDNGISATIQGNPESFWYKNNGITIICDDFDFNNDRTELKLKNFSIVNGGQTSYIIYKSDYVTEQSDFYLSCKVIKTLGNTEDEKKNFSLEIAKATNSQKKIKNEDLKANSDEQIRFQKAMLAVDIFYTTKQGKEIPKNNKKFRYLHTNMSEIGKLCLSAIFQLIGTGRNHPKAYLDNPKYYDLIFDSNQTQIAGLCKELLYIDYYFEKNLKKDLLRKIKVSPVLIP